MTGACARVALSVAAGMALAVAVCNAVVLGATRDSLASQQQVVGFGADCIVVLGAAVLADGTPTHILQDRLDVAAQLYRAGAAPKVLVSGSGTDASNHEATAMKRYLVDMGIPSKDVFCDHAGFNTYDTMWRAHTVFGARKTIVVTQTYHEHRALYDAHGVGMQALGVSSDARQYAHQAYYDFREVFARAKDVALVLLHAPATQAGGRISLEQDGDVTD